MRKAIILLLLVAVVLPAVSAKKQVREIPELRANTHYEARIETSKGKFTIELFNETPLHRDNFIRLVKSDFYCGILFHRVIEDFVIQAGDPSSREASEVVTYGANDVGYKLEAEIIPGLYHRRGAVAAARDADPATNPEKRSSGSQFYVVTGYIYDDSTMVQVRESLRLRGGMEMTPEREKIYTTEGGLPNLDGDYTIFGQVVKGQGVVDKINSVATYRNDRPKGDIYIKTITVKVVKNKNRR